MSAICYGLIQKLLKIPDFMLKCTLNIQVSVMIREIIRPLTIKDNETLADLSKQG